MSDEIKSVSLPVSLTLKIPGGWQESIAIIPGPELLQQVQAEVLEKEELMQREREEKKRQNAERQRKSETKKRKAGFTKDWVPAELLKLAEVIGWTEVIARAGKPPARWWQFWRVFA